MEVGTEVIVNDVVFGLGARGQFIGETGVVIGISKVDTDTLYVVRLYNRKFPTPRYYYKEELSVINSGTDEEYDEGISTAKLLESLFMED